MKSIFYKKILYKPLYIDFKNEYCYINGILFNHKIKFKKNLIFYKNNINLIIKKNYFKTFFSILLKFIDGVSVGFKAILKLKGKGLRIQLKKVNNKLLIYLKLGYSHKIFYNLPTNFWIYIFERRRSIMLYSLSYIELRTVLLKIRNYYPVNLYKIRGFFEPSEIIKQKKGNLDSALGLVIKIKKFMLINMKHEKFLKKLIYYKNINKIKLKKFNNIFIKSGILKFKK
jgi:ribosomal protein L6P/L9E